LPTAQRIRWAAELGTHHLNLEDRAIENLGTLNSLHDMWMGLWNNPWGDGHPTGFFSGQGFDF
jgi:hypothetical protein